jgi:hypothetical protein
MFLFSRLRSTPGHGQVRSALLRHSSLRSSFLCKCSASCHRNFHKDCRITTQMVFTCHNFTGVSWLRSVVFLNIGYKLVLIYIYKDFSLVVPSSFVTESWYAYGHFTVATIKHKRIWNRKIQRHHGFYSPGYSTDSIGHPFLTLFLYFYSSISFFTSYARSTPDSMAVIRLSSTPCPIWP